MKEYYDCLTAWGTIGLGVIAVVALYFESRSARLARAADVVLRLIDKFDDEKMLTLRHKAALSIRDFRQGKGEISNDVENVLDFFETIGMFSKRGVIDNEIVWHSFHHWLRGYYWSSKDFIDKRREKELTVYEDLISLYRKTAKYEGDSDDIPSKSDLDEFIEDEIKEVAAQLELKKLTVRV
jgi:hypothetical protein